MIMKNDLGKAAGRVRGWEWKVWWGLRD